MALLEQEAVFHLTRQVYHDAVMLDSLVVLIATSLQSALPQAAIVVPADPTTRNGAIGHGGSPLDK